jgi:hypothetical protein
VRDRVRRSAYSPLSNIGSGGMSVLVAWTRPTAPTSVSMNMPGWDFRGGHPCLPCSQQFRVPLCARDGIGRHEGIFRHAFVCVCMWSRGSLHCSAMSY